MAERTQTYIIKNASQDLDKQENVERDDMKI